METKTITIYGHDLGQTAEELADELYTLPHATIEYNHTQIDGEDVHVFKISYEIKE